MSWQDRSQRGLALFEGSSDDSGTRTGQIFSHVLDEQKRDDYISRDFFNVQQTAGGLPEGMSFDDYVGLVAGHVRDEVTGSNFGEDVSDEDFRAAALTFDDNIRRHIRFLNGVVHQGAPGEVHLGLWELILNSRADDSSLYSCYRDFLVDA
ncbi:hypothetical protein ABZZ79_36460 [Streptomyces sp. NPDC006458]|uniref:hypothetical protein n=1 Tax=Streptomyces sp. NPDC006458 TaxID=3154302 RepID=UPI0033BD6706